MTQFSELGLAEPILKALAAAGYQSPTPIQAQAIPPVRDGHDLCGIAQTGTGKTAAFALPILHRLQANPKRPGRKSARVLVLSPTRELASQIAESFRDYGKYLRFSTEVVFGGTSLFRQEQALRNGVDILVATPGRLLDLVDRRALSLAEVEILVLDEADQMLDLGFIHSLKRIVKLVPQKRQTLFFSATMPAAIRNLAESFIKDPVEVSVAPAATTAERVEQGVYFINQQEKPRLLELVLRDEAIRQVLVFTRTKHGADKVVKGLEKAGIACYAIHGNKSQGQRERALDAFRAGKCRVLVATDIAARGIDVPGVSHVVNFDLPNVPESYVHRIGRTARAGASGIAVSFCAGDERPYLRDIERLTRLKVPMLSLPEGITTGAPQQPIADQPSRGPRPQGQRPHGANGAGKPNAGKPRRPGHRGQQPRGDRPAQAAGQKPAQKSGGAWASGGNAPGFLGETRRRES